MNDLAELPPVERFIVRMNAMALAVSRPSHELYERHKFDFKRECPDATPAEYERAMRAAARAAGV